MPEKIFKKLNTYILPEWKICFFTALITGLFAHLYKITNWLPNWDSLVFRYDAQNMIAMGRWFLPVVCSFSSFYDLPLLNGITAIIFHALGAVCIVKMFNVHKKITAGLIGAFIVSFPTVTSVMMYNYVADGYSIAFFLSALAALNMTKEKPNCIFSIILITLLTGIYQAYITVTIMLVLFHLTDEIIFNKATFNVILKKTLFMLFTGICAVALYSIILKILLGVLSVELLDYQGANTAASLSNIDLHSSFYVIKETFIKYFFNLSGGLSIYFILNIFILLFTVLYYIKSILKNKIYLKPSNLFAIIFFTIMLIPGSCALAFINPDIDYHNLMIMGYLVFYMFFLIIYERGTEENKKNTEIKCWAVLIISVILILNQIVIANVSYHKAQIAYEKSYGVLIRIADRIEQTEGFEKCDKILVIGSLSGSEPYSVTLPPEITGITDGYIIRKDDGTVGQSVFTSALNDYCGKNYKFITEEEKEKYSEKEDIKSMECWPSKDCIKIIDDIIVVKLGV